MIEKKLKKFYAGGFLYNKEKKQVFLHRRDGNTIYNPHKISFFGGLNEGNETPKECFKRELFEEIGLDIGIDNIIPLDEYMNIEMNTYRHVFYVLSNVTKEELILGEGAGFDWFSLKTVFTENITEKVERDLKDFVEDTLLESFRRDVKEACEEKKNGKVTSQKDVEKIFGL